jgi:prolyl oligopeptidase
MKTSATLILFLLICGPLLAQMPASPKNPVTDSYFGYKVTDNYRWLENSKDPVVTKWFKDQANYTNGILDKISGRDSLIKTFRSYDALKPHTIRDLSKKAGRYFYKKTLNEDNVGKLYYRNSEAGDEILLYDPKPVDGKAYSINFIFPSDDGKKVAFGTSQSGSEISTVYIMNVDTKKLYAEKIFPCMFGITGWSADNMGFIYTVQNSSDVTSMSSLSDTRSMYHVVGMPVSSDRLLFSRKKYPALKFSPEDIMIVSFSEDYKYLFAFAAGVGKDLNCFYALAADIDKPSISWKRLLRREDHVSNFVTKGDDIYMLTYEGAPRSKVTRTNLLNPDIAGAETVVPELAANIETITRSKDFFYFTTNDGINTRAYQYNFDGNKAEEITLPVSGSANILPFSQFTDEVVILLRAWKQPYTIYNYDPMSGQVKSSSWMENVTFPGTDDIVVEEIEIKSHDGVMLPLTIMYNKNVKKDGNAVCFLTGYGAYGMPNSPYFSYYNLALLNLGVVVAETHVRGGGEKGDSWYRAGFKSTKSNTWKDFIASAEYLIQNKYTSAKHLIGEGTSAGGILIGRAITARPDLFAAAINNVGVTNAMRMENAPNGPNNAQEFGTVKDSLESRALYEMDAFLHVVDGTAYPAIISIAGMNDPRVIAWQPAKFAAALQTASSSGKPVLLSVNYDNGHFTENKDIANRNFANMYAFSLWQAGHPLFQLKSVATAQVNKKPEN